MSTPARESRPRRVDGFALEEIDGELLLYSMAGERVLYCNATAALVWQLCDGERTIEAMVELVQAAYPEASERIAREVPATVGLLVESGALTLA